MAKENESQATIFAGNARGRMALEAWADGQPQNFYETDAHLQRVIRLLGAFERDATLEEDLLRFGAQASMQVDGLVRTNDENRHLPQLDRFTDYGKRVEGIAHHPSYHAAGRAIYGSGAMAALGDGPNMLGAVARFYISSYNGEAGHNCPLACTAGLIRLLQELGTAELKQRYLPGLLSRDYDRHLEGAQFLTEIQGGSDVGANDAQAVQLDDGSWHLSGEKWFCSNIDADLFLMTARLPGHTDDGTRGLGLFLVPRTLPDGASNGFSIRRLKEKLGTRSLASGECDFDQALAFHMGELGHGFKNMMNLVINSSRLYNAAACMGLARRAFIDAQRYAQHRTAFGQAIGTYPLVQETLADMRAELEAMVSATFLIASTRDRIDRSEADEGLQGFYRLALNLNKIVTAKWARRAATRGIEVLGGNGAIETFSVLPRLLRDSLVTENWEGTHNTLLMQCLRDMQRYGVQRGFFARLDLLMAGSPWVGRLGKHLAMQRDRLGALLDADPIKASPVWRVLADEMTCLFYAATRAWELHKLSDDDPQRDVALASLEHFIDRKLEGGHAQPGDESYLARIALLSSSI